MLGGARFHDRLRAVLVAAGFDGFANQQCAPYDASKRASRCCRRATTSGIQLVGPFEGFDSERGLESRGADSLSRREFLRLSTADWVPDHSWLSKTRARCCWRCTSVASLSNDGPPVLVNVGPPLLV